MLVERSPLFFNCYHCYRAGSDGCVGVCMWYSKEDLKKIYIYLYKEEGRLTALHSISNADGSIVGRA